MTRNHPTSHPTIRKHHSHHRTDTKIERPASLKAHRGRELVLTDMEPILQAERLRCREAARQLDSLISQLSLFKEVAEPAYARWFQGAFGAHLAEIRELEIKSRELKALIEQVESESFMFNCSEREAFERIQCVRTGLEKIEELRRSQPGFEFLDHLPPEVEAMLKVAFEQVAGDRSGFTRAEYAAMYEEFKENFKENILDQEEQRRKQEQQARRRERQKQRRYEHGDAKDTRSESRRERRHKSSHSEHEHSSAQGRKRASQRNQSADASACKQIYRNLARRLHPDMNTHPTHRQRELWHEVQNAYEAENLERLYTLLATLEAAEMSGDVESAAEGTGLDAIRSVSRLRSVFSDFAKKLKAAQNDLRHAKKAPAWGFIEIQKDRAKLSHLSQQANNEINSALNELRSESERLNARLSRWTNPSPRRGRKSV